MYNTAVYGPYVVRLDGEKFSISCLLLKKEGPIHFTAGSY